MGKNQNKSGQDAVNEAREATERQDPNNFDTGYWPSDDLNEENMPPTTKFGGVRRYWQLTEGGAIHGLYLGTEVLEMPKFDVPEEKEMKAFLVLEIKAPANYKSSKKYGVLVKRPKVDKLEIAVEGDVVYVGVRSQLRRLVMLSALSYQTHLGILAVSKTRTAKNRALWNFEFNPQATEIPATHVSLKKQGGFAELFGFVDQGRFAAEEIFKLAIPASILNMFDHHFPKAIGAPKEAPAIEATATPVERAALGTGEAYPDPNRVPVAGETKAIPATT